MRRNFGRTGVTVSPIALGTWQLGGDEWGGISASDTRRIVRDALEAGIDVIDTASDYGSGAAECLIGDVLQEMVAEARPHVVTKVRPMSGLFAPPVEYEIASCFSAKWIKQECENSLRRLRTEQVGTLLLHTWSHGWDHTDEWHEAFSDLKAEGKIRFCGLSVPDGSAREGNVPIARGVIDVVEVCFNIFQQEPIYSLLPLAERMGLAVIARSPFSSGALAAKWSSGVSFGHHDWRNYWPKEFHADWVGEQAAMADLVQGDAERYGIDSTAAALRFVLSFSSVSCVAMGLSKPAHLEHNLGAASAGELPPSLLNTLLQRWITKDVKGVYNGSI
jgi:aryl-alcohol dehydrogenase-like predicted oxidoreductase